MRLTAWDEDRGRLIICWLYYNEPSRSLLCTLPPSLSKTCHQGQGKQHRIFACKGLFGVAVARSRRDHGDASEVHGREGPLWVFTLRCRRSETTQMPQLKPPSPPPVAGISWKRACTATGASDASVDVPVSQSLGTSWDGLTRSLSQIHSRRPRDRWRRSGRATSNGLYAYI